MLIVVFGVQEYVPHGGVLFKVCVIGPRIYIKQMGSVSDSNSDEVIDVGRVSKLEADRSLYGTWCSSWSAL